MKNVKKTIMLLLIAVIWGYAFVAQSEGGVLAGAYTFNGLRMLLGVIFLIPVTLIKDRIAAGNGAVKPSKENTRKLWKAGILCGVALFIATTVQQIGLNMGTESGKAGFLTAIYILIVPIFSIFLHKKPGFNIWIGVVLALIGLYMLCISGGFSLRLSDILIIICAFCFSVQILLVDHYSPHVDGIKLAMIEFLVTGVISLIPIVIFEIAPVGFGAWISGLLRKELIAPFLFAGVFSCGVAYTLQIEAQRDYNATIASLIMSLEAVFASTFGAIFLQQYMTRRELIGAGIMFAAIIIAQLPIGVKKEV
ncbi:MAG: DMT family transporter [Lachnospiraceae bacterium]|nr:DMT family transporter [Lachnospiraceae bacterium]